MKDQHGTPIEVGDVVQISPDIPDCFFCGCFMLVTEVKPFGAMGFIAMPKARGEIPGEAYFRVESKDFVRIGKAEWAPK